MSRRPCLWLLLPALLWLVACTAQRAAEAPAPAGTGSAPVAAVPADAPPALAPVAGNPLAPDTACTRDADCTVKNVGNCCGAFPACVNTAATVDPQAVARDCAQRGIASVCGFREISACRCVANRCEAAPAQALAR